MSKCSLCFVQKKRSFKFLNSSTTQDAQFYTPPHDYRGFVGEQREPFFYVLVEKQRKSIDICVNWQHQNQAKIKSTKFEVTLIFFQKTYISTIGESGSMTILYTKIWT